MRVSTTFSAHALALYLINYSYGYRLLKEILWNFLAIVLQEKCANGSIISLFAPASLSQNKLEVFDKESLLPSYKNIFLSILIMRHVAHVI